MRRPHFTLRKIPAFHFCWRLSRPQGHSAAGRAKLIERSSDLIGNQTRDLPACSIVCQPTTLPHVPPKNNLSYKKTRTGSCIQLSIQENSSVSFIQNIYDLFHSIRIRYYNLLEKVFPLARLGLLYLTPTLDFRASFLITYPIPEPTDPIRSEDGSNISLESAGIRLQHYMVSQSRRPQPELLRLSPSTGRP
jgi:hypothetical protein